jgi:hypothetical protein
LAGAAAGRATGRSPPSAKAKTANTIAISVTRQDRASPMSSAIAPSVFRCDLDLDGGIFSEGGHVDPPRRERIRRHRRFPAHW